MFWAVSMEVLLDLLGFLGVFAILVGVSIVGTGVCYGVYLLLAKISAQIESKIVKYIILSVVCFVSVWMLLTAFHWYIHYS